MKADFNAESYRQLFLGLKAGCEIRVGRGTLMRTAKGAYKFHTGEAPPAKWSVAYDDARDAAEAYIAVNEQNTETQRNGGAK